MKRMNEVFELPINHESFAVDGHTAKNGEGLTARLEADMYAAHAINNVDALADALECIVMNAEDRAFESWLDKYHPSGDVSEVQYKFEQSSEFKDFIDEFGDAQKALNAYRGAK